MSASLSKQFLSEADIVVEIDRVRGEIDALKLVLARMKRLRVAASKKRQAERDRSWTTPRSALLAQLCKTPILGSDAVDELNKLPGRKLTEYAVRCQAVRTGLLPRTVPERTPKAKKSVSGPIALRPNVPTTNYATLDQMRSWAASIAPGVNSSRMSVGAVNEMRRVRGLKEFTHAVVVELSGARAWAAENGIAANAPLFVINEGRSKRHQLPFVLPWKPGAA